MAKASFSKEDIDRLTFAVAAIASKATNLVQRLHGREYYRERAREFAVHGLSRRLMTLDRCITNVFRKIPPSRVRPPTVDQLRDTAIFLQAFIFNVFGCLDNLAWIWVLERGVKSTKGRDLPPSKVGLGPKCDEVRASMPEALRAQFEDHGSWFDYLEDYRHALAHRIPLYIPPYQVLTRNAAAIQDLELRHTMAYLRRSTESLDDIQRAQNALRFFRPLMTHSFGEGAKPVVFHGQMLADFHTVEDVAIKLLDHLDSAPPAGT